ARAEAVRDGEPAIDLVDGQELADLLKRSELGVQTLMVEKVEVNAVWFTIIADFRSRKLPHNEPGSRVLEGHGEIAQPWNGRAGVVQSGFAPDRVVGSLVTAHHHAVGMDCKPAPSCAQGA